jgi:putative flippase GtrA
MNRVLTVERVVRGAHFGVVSAGSILFTQVLLAGLQVAGLPAVQANALAVTLAAIPTYEVSRRWVWRGTSRHGRPRQALLFWLTALAGFALSTGLVWLLVRPEAPLLQANAVNAAAFGAVWIVKYLFLDAVVFARGWRTQRDDGEPGMQPEPALEAGHREGRVRARHEWGLTGGTLSAARFWAPVAAAVAALLAVPVVTVVAAASVDLPDLEQTRHPGPEAADGDQAAALGEGVSIDGVVVAVVDAALEQRISNLEDGGYLVVPVSIRNESDATLPYSRSEWRVRTPAGHEYQAALTTVDDLGAGEIPPGGEAAGRVLFEVGDETGAFHVTYAPGYGDGGHGVWEAVVDQGGS